MASFERGYSSGHTQGHKDGYLYRKSEERDNAHYECGWCEGLGYRTVSVENAQGSGDIVQEDCERCKQIPKPPVMPTRSRLWHGAHTNVEIKIYERELEEYLVEKTKYYNLIKRLNK